MADEVTAGVLVEAFLPGAEEASKAGKKDLVKHEHSSTSIGLKCGSSISYKISHI